MRSLAASCLVVCPALVVLACSSPQPLSGGTGGTGGGGSSTAHLPCDVDAILQAHCQNCHGSTPSFGAPMPLVTYADLQAPAVTDKTKKVYELVETRIHDDAAPMPQPPYPRLTADQLTAIDGWVKGGAPSSTESCQGTGGSGGSGGAGGGPVALSCTPDIHVAPASSFTMPADQTDLYVCYGIDVPANGRTDVVGFAPKIDNKKIVHHVLLYQSTTSVSSTPAPCDGFLTVGQGKKLLYGWAPGGVDFEMPKEAGMPLDPTTHYFVQVHYNNLQGLTGEMDASGFDLCSTTEARPNAADIVAFGTVNFDLPPDATTTRDCTYTWPTTAGQVHAIAAFPHMHKLGTSIWTKQNPSAAAVDLGKNDPWDFNNQPFIPIAATLNPGDTIETHCAWNNNTPNDVKFGETTEDEMCFSFTMYYPRATSFKTWLAPSAKSVCQ